MEDLPHLIDRDLEQITDSIRPENHDVPVVVVHFAGVTERLLDVLTLGGRHWAKRPDAGHHSHRVLSGRPQSPSA